MITLQPATLSRRILAQHVMLSLAALLTCVAICLSLAWRGLLFDFVSLTVIGPLLLILTGAVMVGRSLHRNTQIENQLKQLAALDCAGDSVLQRLPGRDAVTTGWNLLLRRMEEQQSLDRIVRRINVAADGAGTQRLAKLLDSIPDGIAVTDGDGRISFANRALWSLCGCSSTQGGAGQSLFELLASRCPASAGALHEAAVAGPRAGVLELKRGGNLNDGVLRLARNPVAGGDPSAACVCTLRDVTQQKLSEQMRDEFVWTATHELRTPLANIKAYAETLTEHAGLDVEKQRQFCNTINSEATRLARFVDELLNVSQMESGALSIKRHETDTLRLLEEVVAHVEPELHRKRIVFEQKLPPKLPKLMADKDKLSACLVNLLGNATKYTPEEGHVRLLVETNATTLQFHIEDTGFGIAPEDVAHLGEKFFRSGDERVRVLSGSGLGLAFTFEVARLHGGEVTVHSQLNKGSRFTLTLPLNG